MRYLPWGPELSSASGAWKRVAPTNDHELVARTTVRLPRHVHGGLRVWVGGEPQVEGEDFFVIGRLLVFERPLERKSTRRRLRVLMSSGAGSRRRRRAVDVWYENEDDAGVVYDLDPRSYP